MSDSVTKQLLKKDYEVSLPALLRFARRTYGQAIQSALCEAGFRDIPRHGMYVLGGIARTGCRHGEIVKELALSKQAASQLIDTLVERDYLLRSTDPRDRRCINLDLTERGMFAAETSRAAVESIDNMLVEDVGSEYLTITKRTLAVLVDINDRQNGLPRGKR
jgi:DNA-binding MarR family transcriptional regulator